MSLLLVVCHLSFLHIKQHFSDCLNWSPCLLLHQARNGPVNEQKCCSALGFSLGALHSLSCALSSASSNLQESSLVRQENVSRTQHNKGTVLFTNAVKYCNQYYIRKDTFKLRIPTCPGQMCVKTAQVKTIVYIRGSQLVGWDPKAKSFAECCLQNDLINYCFLSQT